MKKLLLLLFIAFGVTLSHANGIRILFIGDSITDGGWGRSGGDMRSSQERNLWDLNHIYGHSYMFLCAAYYQSAFPEKELQFYNRGISGNTLNDLSARWEEDAIALHPDVISILVGTNDVDASLANDSFDSQVWEKEYRALLDKTIQHNPNVKLVLCTPFTAETGRLKDSSNYRLRESRIQICADIIERLANDYRAILVTYHTLFNHLLKEYPIQEGQYWIWDGIHPTPAGHQRMADLWIENTKEFLGH